MSADHEHAAFVQKLYERYRMALERHVGRLLGAVGEAEDIVQETCARLLRARHLEKDEPRARSYMFRVATNLAYDRHRRRPEPRIDDLPDCPEAASDAPEPDAIIALDQALDTLSATLLRLPPRSRRVFLLRAAEGLSYEAIAERLAVSKRSVERDMKLALDACQHALRRSTE